MIQNNTKVLVLQKLNERVFIIFRYADPFPTSFFHEEWKRNC